jgi:hypothetical protein
LVLNHEFYCHLLRHVKPQLNNGLAHLSHSHGAQGSDTVGRDFRGTESLACDSLRLIPFGASCMQRKDVDTGRFQRARRYRRGSVALRLSASVLRYEVLSASYQYKPAASLGRSASLVPVLPSRIHRSCALVSLPTLELSLSRLLARPLATLYLPLPHLLFFLQSTSLNAHLHLNMPRF